MSTSFGEGATRQVQAGDTPDLNDGLLSRGVGESETILRGNACVIVDGFVEIATEALLVAGRTAFVPIEDGDNSAGVDGDINVSGVTANQRVALLVEADSSVINPGDYVKPSGNNDGTVELWATADAPGDKYARYLGKEAALLDVNSATPFDETLTVGIVPDQILTPTSDDADNVGWFQLVENQGGT